MDRERIEPHRVTKPMQLLAAWLVSLIAIDGTFLTAAGLIKAPSWAPSFLVVAAMVNVPIFLGCMFLLQTKFRPEMQEDSYYAEYLKQTAKLKELSRQLRDSMQAGGLDFLSIAGGRGLSDLPQELQRRVQILVHELGHGVEKIKGEAAVGNHGVGPEVLVALAEGLMAERKWQDAGLKLEEYAKVRPDDWKASYSRGVAFANSRGGSSTDLRSLRAYNDAIVFAPTALDPNMRARLFVYRGAMHKRLNRLDEAEADLLIAEKYAREEYEKNDIKYNFAGVYAMRGDREKALETVRELRQAPQVLAAIRAHLSDYFRSLANDQEFLQAIGARG